MQEEVRLDFWEECGLGEEERWNQPDAEEAGRAKEK